MNSSSNNQITIGVAVLLLMSLMVTLAGYIEGGLARESAATVVSESTLVEGKITHKDEQVAGSLHGPTYTWSVKLSFTTLEGETLDKTIAVGQSAYNLAAVGPVTVTYVKSQPSQFSIANIHDGISHPDADAEFHEAMTFYGAIASGTLGVGLVTLLATRGGGGTPAPHSPATRPARAQARVTSRQPTGEFGARQTRG